MKKGIPISIEDGFKKVKFLDNRAPESSDEDKKDAFANLSEYRDGQSLLHTLPGIQNGKDILKGMR